MDDDILEPHSPDQSPAVVEHDSLALATYLEDSFFETRRLRSDGWDGPTMASFCRTLAETGVVTEACRACGKSAQGAYALRQREPVFARAWEAAISLAREKLADELLARSIRGSVEQIVRNGVIVGERHCYDNRLAFSVLRRLDRRAELGATFRTPPPWAVPDAPAAVSGDWQLVLDAISEDRKDDARLLLAPIPPKIDEIDDPRNSSAEGCDSMHDEDEVDIPYVSRRVWQKWDTDEWRTNFPPPADFAGTENGEWDEHNYWRTLTADEMVALIDAGLADPMPQEITLDEDEAARDAFFSSLATPATEPGSAFTSDEERQANAGPGPA